ncbi:MAG: nucleotidyltransferase domain-containing protein, partial [Candidatus Baldrarchaeia archaeon]
MKRADIVRNWKNAVKKVAKAISDVLPDAEIYVFGSAVKRRITASSDIDLLIFSEKIP